MNILIVALLKNSQIKYKIIPLTKSKYVNKIYLLRKEIGPAIDKVEYVVLPKLVNHTFFYLLLTPYYAIKTVFKNKINLIISYHFLPHGFFAFLTHLVTRRKYIYSQIDMDIQNYMKNGFWNIVLYRILKTAFKINVPGSNSMRFWINRGIKKEKIISIHSTIDTENEYYPNHKEKKYDFVFVGKLDKRKRAGQILDALNLLKNEDIDFRFAIVGDGEDYENVEQKIKKYRLEENVHLLGYREDVKEILDISKAFILLSENEGIPCAMMEAMSCELVPIVTDVADISDVVRNKETGFLLEDNPNVEDVKDILKEVLLDSEKMYDLKKNARKQIVDFNSYTIATERWNKLIEEILYNER